MALQSSTDPAPTQTTVMPAGSSSVANSPAASPALILAFLSIALFSAGMIVVFGWRRVHFVNSAGHWGFYFGSVVPPEAFGSIGGRAVVVDVSEEPKLWNLHTNHLKDGMTQGTDARWESIMVCRPMSGFHFSVLTPLRGQPLSAVVIHGRDHDKQLEESLLQQHPNSLLFLKPFRGYCEDDHKSVSSRTNIQVAVAIALPSPHHQTLRREGRNDCSEQDDREDKRMEKHLEYVIGLYEHPWNAAG